MQFKRIVEAPNIYSDVNNNGNMIRTSNKTTNIGITVLWPFAILWIYNIQRKEKNMCGALPRLNSWNQLTITVLKLQQVQNKIKMIYNTTLGGLNSIFNMHPHEPTLPLGSVSNLWQSSLTPERNTHLSTVPSTTTKNTQTTGMKSFERKPNLWTKPERKFAVAFRTFNKQAAHSVLKTLRSHQKIKPNLQLQKFNKRTQLQRKGIDPNLLCVFSHNILRPRHRVNQKRIRGNGFRLLSIHEALHISQPIPNNTRDEYCKKNCSYKCVSE